MPCVMLAILVPFVSPPEPDAEHSQHAPLTSTGKNLHSLCNKTVLSQRSVHACGKRITLSLLVFILQIVAFASETQNVLAVCVSSDMLRSLLPTLLEQLELCQKSLSAYLETKRAEFPRFYFVSDPTLLEILSLGSDPPSVVPHFQSGLFDSLSNVTFDKVRALFCTSGQVKT